MNIAPYYPMVRAMAHKMRGTLPDSIQVDDLVQDGMIGLIDAGERYRDGGGTFQAYAWSRIHGAMIDGLRDTDWMPRPKRLTLKAIGKAKALIEQKLLRPALNSEIALAANMELSVYHDYMALPDMVPPNFRGHTDPDDPSYDIHDPAPGVLADLIARQTIAGANESILSLPENYRKALTLYYLDGLRLHQVGALMGVSESRASQLVTLALARVLKKESQR